MREILTGLMIGAGIEMPPDYSFAGKDFGLSQLLQATYKKLLSLEWVSANYPQYRPKLVMLLRLIISNHFETFSDDEHDPLTFRKDSDHRPPRYLFFLRVSSRSPICS